jgi:hypothetical protein
MGRKEGGPPLRLLGFAALKQYKTIKSPFKVPRRRTGLFLFACFFPQNRHNKNARKAAVFFVIFCLCVLGFRERFSHHPPELIKFPMPTARHENKKNPAMPGPGPGVVSSAGVAQDEAQG